MANSTIVKLDISNKLHASIDLASYTSSNYLCQTDGYIVANCSGASNAKSIIAIYDVTGQSLCRIGGWGNGTYGTWAVFVKKGMQAKVITLEGNAAAQFVSLEH